MIPRLVIAIWVALLPVLVFAADTPRTLNDFARIVAPLVDPTKLATVGERAANPRLRKVVYWLETARRSGISPASVADHALASVGVNGNAAILTRDALLRNLAIAERLGCMGSAGMADLRKGQSPTIRRGPYSGQELTVDHIIPRAVCRELDNVVANLEFMPAKLNTSKGASIGDRQLAVAQELNRAGLLSMSGLKAVEMAHGR